MLCKMRTTFGNMKAYHVHTREVQHGSMMYGISKSKALSAKGKNQRGFQTLIISEICEMRCIRLSYLLDLLFTEGVSQFGLP